MLEVPGIEPATSWSVVRHAANEAVNRIYIGTLYNNQIYHINILNNNRRTYIGTAFNNPISLGN